MGTDVSHSYPSIILLSISSPTEQTYLYFRHLQAYHNFILSYIPSLFIWIILSSLMSTFESAISQPLIITFVFYLPPLFMWTERRSLVWTRLQPLPYGTVKSHSLSHCLTLCISSPNPLLCIYILSSTFLQSYISFLLDSPYLSTPTSICTFTLRLPFPMRIVYLPWLWISVHTAISS